MLTSLRNRLMLLHLLVVIIVLGLIFYSIFEMRRIETDNTKADARRLVQLIKSEQKRSFTEARQFLQLLALQSNHLTGAKSDGDNDFCHAYFSELLKNFPQYANVGFISVDGRLKCSALPMQDRIWLGDRDYFLEAMGKRDFAVGSYQIGRVTGKSSINFGYPLYDPQKEVAGVLFVALDLNRLSLSLKEIALPEATIITLLGETGIILARYPDPDNLIGQSGSEWPIFSSVRGSKREDTVETLDYQGVNRLYAFAAVAINDRTIYLSVSIPSHVAYAEIDAFYLRNLVFFIFISLISAVAIWLWIGRTILNPLQTLKRTSERLRCGDLTARSKLTTATREVAQLADTFDHMAESLEKHYQEKIASEMALQNLNRALRTLSSGNHALIRATQEQALLEEMCRVAVDEGGYPAAWVGIAEQDQQKTIRPVAFCGIDQATLSGIPLSWSDSAGEVSASGISIQLGKSSLASKVMSNMTDFSEKYLPGLNIEDALALPLVIDGNVWGVFTIYTNKSPAFSEEEQAILGEMAQDLAYGIKTLRLRRKHEEATDTIHRMTFYDTATQFPNHAYFEKYLRETLAVDSIEGEQAALLIIGFDRFKDINNTLGFEAGDRVLKEAGNRIKRRLMGNELLARMRGDEFSIFIQGADAKQAKDRAGQILEILEPLYELDGFSLSVNASLGIVLFPEHAKQPERLLLSADIALQHAKQTGNGFEFYSSEYDSNRKYMLTLAGKLHRAIENDQLSLFYQPKISMTTDRVYGFEALARWFPPHEKMIPPDVFIGLAEKTGMIRAISNWVIEKALQQSYLWRQGGIELPIAINLSARNLHDPLLMEFIEDRLTAWQFERGMLEVEITETSIMEDPDAAIRILTRIRDLGIPLYIDDFGTGQSSLIALKKQPVSALKIDKSFILEMIEDKDAAAIVRATITLARELGLSVVAEGVENEQIWHALKELNCHYGQGYYMGKPMSEKDIAAWLSSSDFGLKNN